MGRFGGQSLSPIGIDLGGYAIKAVQVERAGKALKIYAAVSMVLPVPNHPLDKSTARFVRDTLYRHDFKSGRIVLAAPMQQLAVDVLDVPPRSSGAPVEQIARLELARSAKLGNNLFELSCWDLPAPARAASAGAVMAVALRHEHANALIDPFIEAGFDVTAVDTKTWALARAAATHTTPDTITAAIDIGWNSALMVLLNDGVVVYQRVLPESGMGIILRAIRDEFQLADDEAEYVLKQVGAASNVKESASFAQAPRVAELVRRYVDAILAEIQPAFDYASHRYAEKPLKYLLLCGGGASIAGLCELLGGRVSLASSVLCPAKVAECPASLDQLCSDGVFTTAMGLAMHESD